MLEIIAQFSKHTGPMANGEHRITFDIQKELAAELHPILQQLENYPQVRLHLELIGEKKVDLDKELWTKQNKKIHALFDDIAAERKMKSEDMKVEFKRILIKKGKIKESLSELDVNQQQDLIAILMDDLIEAKFHE